jgi:putative restriction endonuclease
LLDHPEALAQPSPSAAGTPTSALHWQGAGRVAYHSQIKEGGGEHRLDNGLLLRSDVHTLFDRGYLGIDPKYRLLVSRRLREEFGNGEQFYSRAGQTINVPERRHDRPNPEFLEWHVDEVFQAS